MARHHHDQNGRTEGPYTIRVGRDWVTFLKVYCTCGAYVTNRITNTQSEN